MTAKHTPILQGRRILFGKGYSIEATSPYSEWLDVAQSRLNAHGELVFCLTQLAGTLPVKQAMKANPNGELATRVRAVLAKVRS